MMKASSLRLLALAGSMAAVLSCDAGAPTGLGEFFEKPPTDTIGTGGPGRGDGVQPSIEIVTPVPDAVANIGDSILVTVRLRDDASGLQKVEIAGLAMRGDVDLGTDTVFSRYATVYGPSAEATFRAGLLDTTIRRYIQPLTPLDSVQDSVVVRVIATDVSGVADTAFRAVQLVSGPRISIISPPNGDSVPRGFDMEIRVRAEHARGVRSVTLRARSNPAWPTPIDTTLNVLGNGRFVVDTSMTVTVPGDAIGGDSIVITAAAVDVNGSNGVVTPVIVTVRTSAAGPPLVTQTVPSRVELNDPVTITANGDGISRMGFVVRDSLGTIVAQDDTVFSGAAANVATRTIQLPLGLAIAQQGRKLFVTSFAQDKAGVFGYSVAAGTRTAQTDAALAYADSSIVVYGLTYGMPRPGIAGDIAIDQPRGRVFVSNTVQNRVEMWSRSSTTFDPTGVRAGAEPWGMTMTANSPDTLLIANSGGTNISRVYIGAATTSGMTESRLLTRNTVAYSLLEVRDPSTGKIRISIEGPISYSDRPQYIAQSTGGRIYYSTRPTQSAPEGTLRYMDPADPIPDSRQIHQYASPLGIPAQVAVFNVDSIKVIAAPASSAESDSLLICDHNTGTNDPGICRGSRLGIFPAFDAFFAAFQSTGRVTDMEFKGNTDISSLALQDTTFVAWSTDRNWVAFGEGDRANNARVMMVNDAVFGQPFSNIFFTPGIEVSDLIENASERVFGLALDARGRMLGVHGINTHFAAVERPFHIRMQGRFETPVTGAGITYHPLADVDPTRTTSAEDLTRLAFVASESGVIDIVDAYYYRSRGQIRVKDKLYGPLRASLPMAGDPANVVLKLYGMSERGLVVIDLTAADIKPLP